MTAALKFLRIIQQYAEHAQDFMKVIGLLKREITFFNSAVALAEMVEG